MIRLSHVLRATSALIAVPLLMLAPAYADCQPGSAAATSGATVTCTGIETNGFAAGVGVDSLTLNVLGGATVTAPGPGSVIFLRSNNIVANAGLIAVTAGAGINLQGGLNTVTNTGTIAVSASSFGIGHSGGVSLSNTIINAGTITASGVFAIGIILDSGANASTIVNTGTITASGTNARGIWLSANANTATNAGTIRATGTDAIGVLIGSQTFNSVFTNAAGGLVFADAGVGAIALRSAGGVGPSAAINNGTIDGLVRFDNLSVTNNGLITITTGPVGQSHVIGAFTQTAAGTLVMRVTELGAGPGSRDNLTAVTTATLGGTLRAQVQPGLYADATTYIAMVLGIGGFGGTQFATVASSSPFFVATPTYNPQWVDLTLTRVPFGGVPGSTDNQRAVGSALDPFYSTAVTGNAAAIYAALLGSTSLNALDQIGGEVGTGVQNPSFMLGEQFYGSMLGQAQRWRAGQLPAVQQTASGAYRIQVASARPAFGVSTAQAAPGAASWPPRSVGPTWAAWASGFGLSGNRDGDGSVGSARLSYSTGGGAFGVDAQLNPNLLLGAAVGAGGSGFSLDARNSSGDVGTVFFGVYGSWTMGPLYVDAAASYGHGQFSTSRLIALGSINERATGEFGGNQYGGRIEAGWRFQVQRYELTPFAGLSVQALDQGGYTENTINLATSLPGILGLSYQGETTTSVRSFLGAQASTMFSLGERTTLTPRIRVAWAHEFSDDRQVNASFLSIPGAAFTVNGARPARDAAVVGAGVDLGLGRNAVLYAQFDGDISGAGNAYAGSGGIRITW